MSQTQGETIYLKDYRVPDYLVETVELDFDLHESHTDVVTTAVYYLNPKADKALPELVLNGRNVELTRIKLDGEELSADDYHIADELLRLKPAIERFTLEITTRLEPQNNKALEGLYKSRGLFCTQNEAQGFRRITYFLDRPDVLATYKTTLRADKDKYPVLLSNGNCTDQGELDDGRHYATWEDPHKKPCYLYALVAGDLKHIEETFTTVSGRKVLCQVFAEPGNEDKCGHALESLMRSMRWDEEVYRCEYDLDRYMIVAVDDFNAGAMENKGLNIFNSQLVLADPKTATDNDYRYIEGVVAHEYFHNWSGNRVTLRDWFQLSLKEGFTILRDQSYSADQYSPVVQRIEDVRVLRNHQFPEDAGPMAHAVRPESFVEIDNFYTSTVYNKGAEVIRMMHRVLGEEKFFQGTDLYFNRYDGQAVTTDDFRNTLIEASGIDLTRFERWYQQAGTPTLKAQGHYDASTEEYTLAFKQECAATPGQPEKRPFPIPVALGLLDEKGDDLPLQIKDQAGAGETSLNLMVEESTKEFVFTGIKTKPIPSFLRGFSAPVHLNYEYSDQELQHLLACDSDLFNRWDASQKLCLKTILKLVGDYQEDKELRLENSFIDAFGRLLSQKDLDKAFLAEVLNLPSESLIGDHMSTIDVDAIHNVREFVLKTLAQNNRQEFKDIYHALKVAEKGVLSPKAMGDRALKNICLAYLMQLETAETVDLCYLQFHECLTMTDEIAALGLLCSVDVDERQKAIDSFCDKWGHDVVVMNKWFSVQAASKLANTVQRVEILSEHAAFDPTNPNKVRSLVGVFARNQRRFHDVSGRGYRFLADQLLDIDSRNPQLAGRMATLFNKWRRFDAKRQSLMREQIERIAAKPGITSNVAEVVGRALA